jgi:DNA-binding XRE family transcriptional regulator
MLDYKKGGDLMHYHIKEARLAAKLSQDELAKKSGVSRQTISGLESGAITVTTTETLIKIASALGKRVSDIFSS